MNTIIRRVPSELGTFGDMRIILEAAEIIKEGGLVAFPTETVYGLGANAFNPMACSRIYSAKGRPPDNPLIIHIAFKPQLSELAKNWDDKAEALMDKFWPGPLTIIFEGKEGGTIGVRMPKNDIARMLIYNSGTPIAAPSANLSGGPSPTSARHVSEDLLGKIDMILDGGPCNLGLESTVIDCTGGPAILRPGTITREMIESLIGPVELRTGSKSGETPKSPGMKYRHYAPKAALTVVVGKPDNVAAKIKELQRLSTAKKIAVLAKNPGQTLEEMAAGLFYKMRMFDEQGYDEIIIEGVEEEHLGLAIMDRLKKASGDNVLHV